MAEKLSSQEDSASEGYARENSILASLLPRLSFGKQCIFSQLSDGKTKGGKEIRQERRGEIQLSIRRVRPLDLISRDAGLVCIRHIVSDKRSSDCLIVRSKDAERGLRAKD